MTLPARLAPALAEAPEPAVDSRASAAGWRILVVDDNVDAAALLAESLSTLGHTVDVAHDGPSALAAAKDFLPHAASTCASSSRWT